MIAVSQENHVTLAHAGALTKLSLKNPQCGNRCAAVKPIALSSPTPTAKYGAARRPVNTSTTVMAAKEQLDVAAEHHRMRDHVHAAAQVICAVQQQSDGECDCGPTKYAFDIASTTPGVMVHADPLVRSVVEFYSEQTE